MLGLSLLGKLIGGETVALRPECCLRRYRRATCEACAKHCPLGAIDLGQGAPRVRGDCAGCGVCVSVCPVGVFELGQAARKGLPATLRAAGPLGLGCTLGRSGVGGAVPCLGYLDAGTLLALGAGHRPINLHVGGCGGCRFGSALEAIRQEATRANDVAEAVGLPATVRLVEEKVSRPVGDADAATCSRRELFGYLRGHGVRAGAVAIAEWERQLASFGTERGEALPVEHKGEALVTQLRRLAAQAGDTGERMLPLRRPVADERCDLCGVCAAACPSGALRLTEDGTTVALRWRAAGCWSCGLCRDVCPVGALRYDDGIPVAAFAAEGHTILAAGGTATCGGCGRCFVDREGGAECPRCREERVPAIAGSNPFGLGRPSWLGRQDTAQPTKGGSGQ